MAVSVRPPCLLAHLRMGVRCLSSVQSSLLGDFQLLGVHDTALVRPPKPVVDLVLHLRPSVARPLVIDAACCLRVDGEVRRGPNRRGRLYRVM